LDSDASSLSSPLSELPLEYRSRLHHIDTMNSHIQCKGEYDDEESTVEVSDEEYHPMTPPSKTEISMQTSSSYSISKVHSSPFIEIEENMKKNHREKFQRIQTANESTFLLTPQKRVTNHHLRLSYDRKILFTQKRKSENKKKRKNENEELLLYKTLSSSPCYNSADGILSSPSQKVPSLRNLSSPFTNKTTTFTWSNGIRKTECEHPIMKKGCSKGIEYQPSLQHESNIRTIKNLRSENIRLLKRIQDLEKEK